MAPMAVFGASIAHATQKQNVKNPGPGTGGGRAGASRGAAGEENTEGEDGGGGGGSGDGWDGTAAGAGAGAGAQPLCDPALSMRPVRIRKVGAGKRVKRVKRGKSIILWWKA